MLISLQNKHSCVEACIIPSGREWRRGHSQRCEAFFGKQRCNWFRWKPLFEYHSCASGLSRSVSLETTYLNPENVLQPLGYRHFQ
jgi:hypothetical protein